MGKASMAGSDMNGREALKDFLINLLRNKRDATEVYLINEPHFLIKNLDRYIQPFRFITKALFGITYYSLVITNGIAQAGLTIIFNPAQEIMRGLLDFINPDQINEDLNKWIEQNTNGEDEPKIPGPLTEIRLTAISLFRVIFKPFSEVKGSKFLSFLSRPIYLLISPVILSTVILIRAIDSLSKGIEITSRAAIAAIVLILLTVLNTPLLLLDFSQYLTNKWKGLFNRASSKPMTKITSNQVSSALGLLSPHNEQTPVAVNEEQQTPVAVNEEQQTPAAVDEEQQTPAAVDEEQQTSAAVDEEQPAFAL